MELKKKSHRDAKLCFSSYAGTAPRVKKTIHWKVVVGLIVMGLLAAVGYCIWKKR